MKSTGVQGPKTELQHRGPAEERVGARSVTSVVTQSVQGAGPRAKESSKSSRGLPVLTPCVVDLAPTSHPEGLSVLARVPPQ